MARQAILDQITQSFGFVPGLMEQMPDAVLEQYWTTLSWVLGDTKLTARDKALVAFGAASALHCGY
jgi:alkylhydroperoxidase/carboxymuconolactone decarboxylase family protein YurZ